MGENIYLGDGVSVGGGCQDAVIARTRYGWVKFRERCILLCYIALLLMGDCIRQLCKASNSVWN